MPGNPEYAAAGVGVEPVQRVKVPADRAAEGLTAASGQDGFSLFDLSSASAVANLSHSCASSRGTG